MGFVVFFHFHNLEATKGGGPKTRETKNVLYIPSLVRVRRPCRGLEKFFPPVLQRCYGCSFHAQEIVHTGHGMLGYYCFFFFFLERKVPAQSKLKRVTLQPLALRTRFDHLKRALCSRENAHGWLRVTGTCF